MKGLDADILALGEAIRRIRDTADGQVPKWENVTAGVDRTNALGMALRIDGGTNPSTVSFFMALPFFLLVSIRAKAALKTPTPTYGWNVIAVRRFSTPKQTADVGHRGGFTSPRVP